MELFLDLLNGELLTLDQSQQFQKLLNSATANTGNEVGQSDSPSIFRTLQLQ